MLIVRLKSRLLPLLIFLCFIFSITGTGQTAEVTVKVTADKAWIRLNPMEESKVIASVPKNVILDLLEIAGDWFRVQLKIEPENIVIIGFVHNSEVQVTEQTLPEEEIQTDVAEEPEEEIEKTQKIVVTAERGDLKVEPNPDSRTLGLAPKGTILESTGMTGRWHKVYIVPDNTELVAYIHESQVQPVEAQDAQREAESPPADIQKIVVTAELGEIKVEPKLDSRTLGQAPRETTLESPGKTGSWYKVYIVPGNTDLVGYIHERQIMPAEEFERFTAVEEPEEKERTEERIPEKRMPIPEKKPAVPSTTPPSEGLYFKGLFGFGFGFDNLYLFMWTENEDKIYINTGGGANIQAKIGFAILPSLALEAGFGYQSQSEHPTVSDGGATFGRMPITLSILYRFLPGKKMQFYAGVGSGVYLSPRLKRELLDIRDIIKYKNAFGIRGIAGMIFHPGWRGNIQTYFEVVFEAAMLYTYTSATENGFAVVPPASWREFKGDQVFINLGILFSPKMKR